MLKVTIKNCFSSERAARAPLRYGLLGGVPTLEDGLNVLIQRAVEHGFVGFFDQTELFVKRLTLHSPQYNFDKRFQSAAITMENIWIYVYIFAAANSLAAFAFLCELTVFHHEKISCRFAFYCHKLLASVSVTFAAIRNASEGFLTRSQAIFYSFWEAVSGVWTGMHSILRSVQSVLDRLWTNLRAIIRNAFSRRVVAFEN